jgi:hypothetical protein
VVAVDSAHHVLAHADESGGLEGGRAALQRPGDGRVPERVRTELLVGEPGELERALEPGLDRLDGLAVPFDEVVLGDPEPAPAAEVCKQLVGDRGRPLRLGLVRSAADRAAIEQPVVEIDPRAARLPVWRGRRD